MKNVCAARAAAIAVVIGAAAPAPAQLSLMPLVKHAKAQAPAHHAPPPLMLPHELAPPQEAYAAFPEDTPSGTAPSTPSPCQTQLAKVAAFQALPVLIGPGECGAPDAVLLQAILLPDHSKVVVAPPATLRCSMAEQVAEWVRDDVAPLTLKFGSPVRGLDNFDSYECRGRNRVRGARLSEHGRANALDVRQFKLADGRAFALTDINVDKSWREALKASACARFSTVLGPGSDGSHEEHIHLDLAERHNGYKICEWDVREPAQAQAAPAQQEHAAESEDNDGDEAEAAPPPPLENVPLPRPRPRHL